MFKKKDSLAALVMLRFLYFQSQEVIEGDPSELKDLKNELATEENLLIWELYNQIKSVDIAFLSALVDSSTSNVHVIFDMLRDDWNGKKFNSVEPSPLTEMAFVRNMTKHIYLPSILTSFFERHPSDKDELSPFEATLMM